MPPSGYSVGASQATYVGNTVGSLPPISATFPANPALPPLSANGPYQAPMPSPYGYIAPPMPQGYSSMVSLVSPPEETIVTRRQSEGEAEAGLQLAAVVVTLCYGTSYDDLFQKVSQKGIEGTYVATYVVRGPVKPLLEALQGGAERAPEGSDMRRLFQDMQAVDPQSVVFNWECCSGCTDGHFHMPAEGEVVMELIDVLIKKGHMVMCSDFSLKALIKQWNPALLGPNPFVKVKEFGGTMSLRFDPEKVKRCPSAQLQRVGDLCESGEAEIKALAGTIVYTVDRRVPLTTSAYTMQVLTVVTKLNDEVLHLPGEQICNAGPTGEHKGAAGHVLLRYPSGGMLLTSAGHWIELVRLDVSEARLLEAAAATYGQAYSENYAAQLNSAAPEMRAQVLQTLSAQMVQQSAPTCYSLRM